LTHDVSLSLGDAYQSQRQLQSAAGENPVATMVFAD
jgi:hypothetical protein